MEDFTIYNHFGFNQLATFSSTDTGLWNLITHISCNYIVCAFKLSCMVYSPIYTSGGVSFSQACELGQTLFA